MVSICKETKKPQNKNQNTQVMFPITTSALGKEVTYHHCWRNFCKTCYYLYRFGVFMCKEGKLI